MSDIICSYYKDDQENPSFFLMERNVSFLQFLQFLHSSSIVDDSYAIYHANQLIHSEETFQNMMNSIHSSNYLDFIFKNKNPIHLPVDNQPEHIQNAPENLPEPEFGETIKSIAEKIGMKLEKIPERPREVIESIPFPHKCVFTQYMKRVRQNPGEMESIIQQAATFYSVDASMLLKEVQEVIQYYKEKRNNRKSCQNKEEKQEKKENQLFGENIQKILNEFHLDYSNIQSAEDFDRLIEQLPQPLARLVNIKLARVAANPNKLKWISKRMSKRFNVPEEQLFEEAKGLVEQYIHFTNTKEAKESENKGEGAGKSAGFHPARCDACKDRIQGIRYWCLSCRNYDLCSSCEEKNERENFHEEKHIFAKIKDARTAYRAFSGGMHQGIRSRVHPKEHMMPKRFCKGPMEGRLQCLEESVQLLKEKLKTIENNKF